MNGLIKGKNILIKILPQSEIKELASMIERIFVLKEESNKILRLLKIA